METMHKITDSLKKCLDFLRGIVSSIGRLKTYIIRHIKLFFARLIAFFRAVWAVFNMLRLALLIVVILAVLIRLFFSKG
jgi:hypothetical protein